MKLSDPITSIKGIGKVRASLFEKLDILNIGALLYHFPRAYTKYPDIIYDIETACDLPVAIAGNLIKSASVKKTRYGSVTTAYLLCNNKKIDLVWFNIPYIKNSLNNSKDIVFYGKIEKKGKDSFKMDQPVIFKKDKYNDLVGRPLPIYPLTKDLKNNTVRDSVQIALNSLDESELNDYISKDCLKEFELLSQKDAFINIHFPLDFETVKKARKRLVFNEFFDFFMKINQSKDENESEPNRFSFKNTKEFNNAIQKLPFTLTKGQLNALEDIQNDLNSSFITQRMIQADVGSGKTIIAFLIMLLCAENGYKSAIMAPTEVLSTQHFNTFIKLKETLGIKYKVVLLNGKMSTKDKKSAKELIAKEEPCFIIGTHALIQKSVTIDNLAFVVVDEQHRFGVKQRQELSNKGNTPFSLVMSATPIPRSLAKILYSDMNITIITDVPKMRLPIKNCVLKEDMRKKAYQFLINEVNKGHQGYIICPLVDVSEKTDAQNVTEYYEKIKSIFPENIRISMLHGKMSPEEKNEIMTSFSNHESDVLISTTVIEVGIDVPNSTVIMIENASRFGLSQLHQLRGRVGRGEFQSYCIFMDDKDDSENERLKVISSSNDGFHIANEDLKLRGPGELYGLRQSGGFGFKLADIYTDADVLMIAKDISESYIKDESLMKLWKESLCQERLISNNWYNI